MEISEIVNPFQFYPLEETQLRKEVLSPSLGLKSEVCETPLFESPENR